MKMAKVSSLAVFVTVLAGVSFVGRSHAQEPVYLQEPGQIWDASVQLYTREANQSDQDYFKKVNLDLRARGLQGWELMSFAPEMRANPGTFAYIAVFKRAVRRR